MKSPSFLNYENLKFGKFSQLLKAKFQNNEKSSSVEELINEITSPKFEKKLKNLVKNNLAKYYSQRTIEKVLNETSFRIINNENEIFEDEPGIEISEPEINYIVENEKIDEILKVQKRVPSIQSVKYIFSYLLISSSLRTKKKWISKPLCLG
jgi:hypothetical protein